MTCRTAHFIRPANWTIYSCPTRALCMLRKVTLVSPFNERKVLKRTQGHRASLVGARRTEAMNSTALRKLSTIVHRSRQHVYERFWLWLLNKMSRLAIHSYEYAWTTVGAILAAPAVRHYKPEIKWSTFGPKPSALLALVSHTVSVRLYRRSAEVIWPRDTGLEPVSRTIQRS